MKFIIKTCRLICICILFIGCDKFKPTKQSTTSFNDVFTSVNWNNPKPDKKSIKTSCSPNMVKMAIANLPKKLFINKESHPELFFQLNRINSKFDDAIKTYDLENKLTEDTGFFKVSAKDKLLNARNNARNESDFIKKVKTRRDGKSVDWGKKEKKLNKTLSSIYKTETGIAFVIESKQIHNCSVLIQHSFKMKELTSTKITLATIATMFFTCKCAENSKKTDIQNGRIVFSTDVEVTFPNDTFDLNAMLFTNKGNPEYRVETASCCKDKTEGKEKD